MSVTQQLESALTSHEHGDFVAAERYFQQALETDPRNVDVIHSAGVLALQVGNFSLASARLRRAIELGVNLAGTHLLLGRALKGQGDLDGAIASYRRAIDVDRDMVDVRICLGLALKEKGRLEEALDAYRSALSINPDSFDARLNLANIFLIQGRMDDAYAAYKEAARLQPESPQLQHNLGKILRAQGRDAEAAERFQQAVLLDEGYLDAYYNLGNALTSAGHYQAAIECYRHLLALLEAGAGWPTDPEARERLQRQTLTSLAAPLAWSHRFEEALPILQEALAREPDSVKLLEYWLLVLPYRCERRDDLLDAYMRYQSVTPARMMEPLVVSPREAAPEKLRIGYLSGDFRDHSIAFFLEPILANHDRQAFEITCYSMNAQNDFVTLRLTAYANRWVDVKELDDTLLAQRIIDDGVDILIDLSGRTTHNRLGVFARQPAWVQIGYLGYPTYTGIPQIAYRITDGVIDPPGEGGLESEQPLRLPHGMFCYRPPAYAPTCSPGTSARERGHVCFGSFNQVQKLSPAILGAWAQILAAMPDSRLLLKALGFNDEQARQRIVDFFTRAGIAAERVMIRTGTAERSDHLVMYSEIDIALDTFPYNGTTTTCEALWMGVPVITLAGETHPSRVGASILTRLGLPELIAHSIEGYLDLARSLASELDRLEELHGSLRQRFSASTLCDEKGFTCTFEQALHDVWRSRPLRRIDKQI